MKKKEYRSVAVKLSLRFSVLLAAAVLLLSVLFTLTLRHFIRIKQSSDLFDAASEIVKDLAATNTSNRLYMFSNVPYFITYTVYDAGTGIVMYTNDPFLPILPQTDGKAVPYISKGYFTNGDLNILYYAVPYFHKGRSIIIQTVLNMDSDSTELLLQGIPRTITFLVIPVLLVSFCISLFITRHTMRPVVKMTQTAREISSSNLDQKLPVKHKPGSLDEIDGLALTFNDLFTRLKSDFERERSFTSDVSHELKTPVAVVLGQSNLLRRWGKDDPAQLEKSLEIIIREANSMKSIITNLLQLSRLENGRLSPSKSDVDVGLLFARLREETRSVSAGSRIVFGENEGHVVHTDAELLHQVCTIIISNSIKFAGPEAVIELSFAERPEEALICIQDNGPGFSPEVLPHVFERFFRGDSSHSRSSGGSGLGLSIARAIMQTLGGSVTASNGNPGALLTVTLPRDSAG